MVGAAGLLGGDGGETDGFQRFTPRFEEGLGHIVFLEIDAAEAPGAVVHVEVEGEIVVAGELLFLLAVVEIIGGIAAGAAETELLAAPKGEADSAPGLDAQLFKDTHGLDHGDAAGGIIGGAGACLPGIEMGAEEHHFIF